MPERPRNVGASVRQRLLNLAHARGRPMELLLTRYALERRLQRPSSWVMLVYRVIGIGVPAYCAGSECWRTPPRRSSLRTLWCQEAPKTCSQFFDGAQLALPYSQDRPAFSHQIGDMGCIAPGVAVDLWKPVGAV